jgi:hypothetical protein
MVDIIQNLSNLQCDVLSHVRCSVTNNCGFWIWWSYPLAVSITAHTQSWLPRLLLILLESESYITTDGQWASPSWDKAPIWGLRAVLLVSNSCGFVDMRCFLWREGEFVVYNCCWTSPAQSFSSPSPLGLGTVFYCLRFETSLFVAS